MTELSAEAKRANVALFSEKIPVLVILTVLVFLIFARTGESIHGQMTKLGEYFWDDYFSLRAEPKRPTCDLQMDITARLNQLEAQASQSSDDFDDLLDSGFDREAARTSLENQHRVCQQQYQALEQYEARVTIWVKLFRGLEHQFSQASIFATAQQAAILLVLLFFAAGIATHKRHHIAFRPMIWSLDFKVSTTTQFLANASLAISAWLYRSATYNSSIAVNDPFMVNGLMIGTTVLAVISLYQLFNIPKRAIPGGKVGHALLSIPLYTYVMLIFAVVVFFQQQHPAGLSIYFSAYFDNAGTYLDVGLYLWCGMLLKQTQIGERVFSIFTPWKLPPELLATVAILVMAIPTAYTGASSIIILAAGTVVYRELRKVGTRRQLALAVTAMSGSSGVVLAPCLIVIIISILNKQVTTDALFHWGARVFLLTVVVFFIYAMIIKREPLRLAPFSKAWRPSLANMRPLIPYIIVFFLVSLVYSIFLEAHLDQFSAPIMLPVILFAIIVFERYFAKATPIYHDPERSDSVGGALTRAMSDASEHIGALLFLMATFIIMTSLGGKVVSATFITEIENKWLLMTCLMFMFVAVGMFMESIAAIGLISLAMAPFAYQAGVNPVHFWMTCLVALELGYLTPPMNLSHLFTRQIVGETECGKAAEEGDTFFYRHERLILPIMVMGTVLLIVTFGPVIAGLYS
ncbi:Putative integral membrane protein [gamma proteobacterium HdN1]|nr:Putative integral membrane protein [gamma proteobacterium HdN1]